MEKSLKELIELSCSSGSIDIEAKNLIYKKAAEQGIPQSECDVYIQGFINRIEFQKNNSKTKSIGWHIFGLLLYFSAFWDAFFSLKLFDSQYTIGYGFLFEFSALVIFYFAFRFMRKESFAIKLFSFILTIAIVLIGSMFLISSSGLNIRSSNSKTLFLISVITFTVLFLYIFRGLFVYKKFAEKLSLRKSNSQR